MKKWRYKDGNKSLETRLNMYAHSIKTEQAFEITMKVRGTEMCGKVGRGGERKERTMKAIQESTGIDVGKIMTKDFEIVIANTKGIFVQPIH